METLEARQIALKQKSDEARAKQQARNRSGSKKRKKTSRPRRSLISILKDIAGDPKVNGRDRMEACKLIARMEGHLPEEVITIDKEPEPEQAPATSPVRESVNWPTKPV